MVKNYNKNYRTKPSLKSRILTALVLSSGITIINAQVKAYHFEQLSETFSPLTGGTILASATGNTTTTNLNSEVFQVNFPANFNFNFNGVVYQNLYMSSNGFVTFGNTAPSATNTTPISTNLLYDGTIAPFGRDTSSFFDVNSLSGDMRYDVVGTAPNRELILQWTNFRPVAATVTNNVYSFSFQLKLKEGSNEIKATYSSGNYLVGNTAITQTAQIGLRGFKNTDFNTRLNSTTQSFNSSTTGTAYTSTQSFSTLSTSTQGMPADGLTYKWTPPTCFAPRDLVASSPTATTVDLQWEGVNPIPANGYDIYYSTLNEVPTSSTVPQITGHNSASITLTNLLPSKYYFVWVRSSCGTGNESVWSTAQNFSTSCVALDNVVENFDSYGTGNIVPTCWVRLTSGTSGIQTINAVSPASGTRNIVQICGAAANPVIVVLPETTNMNAGTHRLRFKARVNSTTAGVLHVGYVTDIANYSSFTIVESVPVTNNTYSDALAEKIVNFPGDLPNNARVAIKNQNDGLQYYWDDVNWELAPSCLAPTSVVASNVTANGVTVSWQDPVVSSLQGYDIYYNTTNIPPTATTPPTFTNITGNTFTIDTLQPAYTHYIWLRTKCTATSTSLWSSAPLLVSTPCLAQGVTSVENATVCGSGSATLRAVSSPGLNVKWYDAQSGGAVVGTGNEFVTPNLSTTQDYWVATDNYTTGYVGMPRPVSYSGNTGLNNIGIVFDAYSNITINEIDIYAYSSSAAGNGTITIAVVNANGTTIHTGTYPVNSGYQESGAIKNTLPLNFSIPAGNGYQLVVTDKTGAITGLIRENVLANMNFPYVLSPVCGITSSTSMPYYYYFYNMKATGGCESPRQLVRATVDRTCLGTSEAMAKNDIKVYPNPFVESITITNYADVKSAIISDLSGRLVRTLDKVDDKIHLNDLTSGMYILTLKLKDDSRKSIKIIKK